MRDRHLPRLCRSCDAPMARQEDACWSCEAAWDYGRSAPGPAVIGRAPAVARAKLGRESLGRRGRRLGDGSRRIGAQIPAVQ